MNTALYESDRIKDEMGKYVARIREMGKIRKEFYSAKANRPNITSNNLIKTHHDLKMTWKVTAWP
jgi:hypothetical protein